MNFQELFQKGTVIFDGAMGTELQKRGLKPGQPSEVYNFIAPEKVGEVTRLYAQSGSDIVSTNTFCANRYKLSAIGKSVDETIKTATNIAFSSIRKFPNTLVSLDIGPIGKLLRPTGTMSFDEAYEIFAEQVRAGVESGVNLITLMTFSDLLELKAAILAAKENSSLPIIASMTFSEPPTPFSESRTFTGCPVSSFAITVSGLGVDAIGLNCSFGPSELFEVARELLKWTTLPIMIKPNAGLPDPVTGKFSLSPNDFSLEMEKFIHLGVKIIGGCCGTSPEYIRLLSDAVRKSSVNNNEFTYFEPNFCDVLTLSSGTKTVTLDKPRVIGERINPTGKKLFKEALKNNDIDYILGKALEQSLAGADILDVNVGLPEIDEKEMMVKVVEDIQGVCDLPLQIDSNDPEVIEIALRHYCGKPIINSVNGKEESLAKILPLAKKYSAAVIGLTLDENGIPETAEGRLNIARRILEKAIEIGINKNDVIIDCLTLTVSTDPDAARTTLEAVKLIRDTLDLNVALGVSNVSFGLPNREIINASFLTSALYNGLTLPIINPNSESAIGAVRAFKLINKQDPNAADYISSYSGDSVQNNAVNKNRLTIDFMPLGEMIIGGLKKDSVEVVKNLLKTLSPMEIIDNELIPILDKVGEDFEKGKIFLPQLILAAQTAGNCFDIIRQHSFDNNTEKIDETKKIILATVQGDIHDIGKNIVKVLLKNYGYKIIDLGKDVPPQTIVDSVIENCANLVGLSALMTTTLPAMKQTINLIHELLPECKVMVGGAVLNSDYAKTINADFYARDAKGAVDIAKRFFGDVIEPST